MISAENNWHKHWLDANVSSAAHYKNHRVKKFLWKGLKSKKCESLQFFTCWSSCCFPHAWEGKRKGRNKYPHMIQHDERDTFHFAPDLGESCMDTFRLFSIIKHKTIDNSLRFQNTRLQSERTNRPFFLFFQLKPCIHLLSKTGIPPPHPQNQAGAHQGQNSDINTSLSRRCSSKDLAYTLYQL